ncbi:MAG: HAD family phosphatase [Lachnospiraceae bacterium]|nr:HAD family phosphatase [Lachnospiraceae bacterium]
MIKNIIFDMGDVLLRFRPELALQKFFEREEDRELIRRELFQGPEWILGDRGIITNAQRYDGVKERLPESLHPALKRCVEGWIMCIAPNPGAEEFCLSMKESGYGIYVLSNACDRFYDYFPQYFDLQMFNGIMVSSDVHMIKPEKKIYEHFLSVFGLKAEECLFIDDRPENVKGAETVGIAGVVFGNDFAGIRERYGL